MGSVLVWECGKCDSVGMWSGLVCGVCWCGSEECAGVELWTVLVWRVLVWEIGECASGMQSCLPPQEAVLEDLEAWMVHDLEMQSEVSG